MSKPANSALPPLDVSYEDDPRVVEEAATEDYSLHIVPSTWRMGRWPLTMAWFAVATAFFYMYFAAFLALAYGTWNALIGIALTVIAYALVNYVILRTASRSGLTVALFSRSMFGFVGASIATLIFAATCIYYLVFEGSVIAVAAQEFFGGPIDLWYAIVIAVTAPLVWKGVRTWLDRLNGWLLPFYIIGLVAVVVWALADRGYNGFLPDAEAAPGTTLPWLQCFAAYMGVWILMMFTFDFARLREARGRGLPQGDHVRLAVLPADVPGERPDRHPARVDVRHLLRRARRPGERAAGVDRRSHRDPRPGAHRHHADAHQHREPLPRVHEPAELLLAPAPESAAHGLARRRVRHRLPADAHQHLLLRGRRARPTRGSSSWRGSAVALAHVVYLRRHGRTADHTEFRPGRIPALNPGGILGWGIASVVGVVLKITDTTTSQFFDTWGLLLTFVLGFVIYTAATHFAKPSWFAMRRENDPALEVDDPDEARVRCHSCDKSYLAREMDRDPIGRSAGDLRRVRIHERPLLPRGARGGEGAR